MSEQKSIYDLKLHESLFIEGLLSVRRVPGGWMYEDDINNVFVPYSDEFLKQKTPEDLLAEHTFHKPMEKPF